MGEDTQWVPKMDCATSLDLLDQHHRDCTGERYRARICSVLQYHALCHGRRRVGWPNGPRTRHLSTNLRLLSVSTTLRSSTVFPSGTDRQVLPKVRVRFDRDNPTDRRGIGAAGRLAAWMSVLNGTKSRKAPRTQNHSCKAFNVTARLNRN